jgi:nucleotide-binding universal stress UspA family protein
MALRRIVVGVDGSAASRQAMEMAVRLAGQSGATVSRIRVVPARPTVPERREDLQFPSSAGPSAECVTAIGLPGVEITRYAETEHADLVVLGRTFRSDLNRRLVGDTGDAVARRSTAPVLFIRPVATQFRRILVALDGSVRGMKVIRAAEAVARAGQLELHVLTVEPNSRRVDSSHAAVPSVAEEHLNRELDRLGHDASRRPVLSVRYGEPVSEILEQVQEQEIDVLAFGFHRGGPAGMVEGQSVGRRLLHLAGCAVLTVPL